MRISDWSSDVCSSDLKIEAARISKSFREMMILSAKIFSSFGSGKAVIALKPLCATSPRLAPRVVKSIRSRSEEHTSELQSLMRISYAVFCLKKKKKQKEQHTKPQT